MSPLTEAEAGSPYFGEEMTSPPMSPLTEANPSEVGDSEWELLLARIEAVVGGAEQAEAEAAWKRYSWGFTIGEQDDFFDWDSNGNGGEAVTDWRTRMAAGVLPDTLLPATLPQKPEFEDYDALGGKYTGNADLDVAAQDARAIYHAATVGCAESADWDAWRPMAMAAGGKNSLDELKRRVNSLQENKKQRMVALRMIGFHNNGRTYRR